MLLAEHGRLAILSPRRHLRSDRRYSTTGASNLDHYLKGHGDPIIVDRVSRLRDHPPPCPHHRPGREPVLRGLVARGHGRGLLARFPTPSRRRPRPPRHRRRAHAPHQVPSTIARSAPSHPPPCLL
jgi:hypothetical protein